MAALSDNLKEAMHAYERSHIERVLRKMDGDKKAAAEALGMSLSSLYRKLNDLAIGAEAKATISVPERGSSAEVEGHVRYHE
jgi:DNA-binding NtrC family response regulator